ncbi:MAG: phosphatase PAP2 family protein [Parachlamydiaceae bacterium]|nr:phosphatase PAP2 family protein [Parachlamydiaceae bacterium]
MKSKVPFPLWKGIILPIFLFLLLTPWMSLLDIKVSAYFYNHHRFLSNPFWDFIFVYGIWPAWILIFFAFIGLLISFKKNYDYFRKPCLYLILTLAIGSGLFVHLVLKEHWGRPRPRQVIEFGGEQTFKPYYVYNGKNINQPSKSFSCGHCSVGFFFFALALFGKYAHSRLIFWIGLGLALILGILLSLARIAQGGHFFSDTLASALIMWLTAWILSYFLLFKNRIP